jgi:hypothetical protein
MEGAGGYNRDSAVQAAGLLPAVLLFRDAADHATLPRDGAPLIIADYGAYEGRNSMVPIRAAIDRLRERTGPDRAIWVVHTDLPGNDFAALFNELETGADSYLRGTRGVYPSAVGRSFYEQILPRASVTLGWSSWAVQWLSRVPGPIPDHLQVAFSKDAAAHTAYAAQAAADWRAFLSHRAAELAAGGRLVVLTMALDDAGDFGYRPLLAAMYAALGDLVAAGAVRAGEAAEMAIPTVGRSLADLLSPFQGGVFHGLRVEFAEVFQGEDRIWADYLARGDSRAYAESWTAFSRASVFPTLAERIGGADANARRAAFITRLSEATARRLMAAPEAMKIPLARLSLRAG